MIEALDDDFVLDSINKDIMSRNSKLVSFINLVTKQEESSIISLNGLWGCGKTVFAKQMEYLFMNYKKYEEICRNNNIEVNINLKKHAVFYYNSWENDAINLPVQSLVLQMVKYFKIKYESAIDIKSVLKPFINILLRIKTLGMLGYNDINAENINDINIDNLIDKTLQVENLRICLNELIDQILCESKDKLVIIIDELDRCRPTYAIEMLECIKHFYNNDKVVFVVITNNIQLSKTIQKVYGTEYDGSLYLQRFYDFIINLRSDTPTLEKYITFKLQRDVSETHIYNEIIYTCIKYFHLELRQINFFIEQEKVAEDLLINRRYSDSNEIVNVLAFLFCCIAFASNSSSPEVFDKYIKGEWNESKDFLEYNKNLLSWLENYGEIKKELDENYTIDKLIIDIYLSIFSNNKVENQNSFISRVQNMYRIKYKINEAMNLVL